MFFLEMGRTFKLKTKKRDPAILRRAVAAMNLGLQLDAAAREFKIGNLKDSNKKKKANKNRKKKKKRKNNKKKESGKNKKRKKENKMRKKNSKINSVKHSRKRKKQIEPRPSTSGLQKTACEDYSHLL